MRHFRFLLLMVAAGGYGYAQTQLHLQTQAKAVDFSNANSTRPVKTGTALPPVCSPGELYFKRDAPSGQNLYGCTANNIWTPQASGSTGTGGGSAAPGGVSGQIQVNDNGSGLGGRFAGAGLVIDSISVSVDTSVIADLASTQTITGDKSFSGNAQVAGLSAQFDASGASVTKPMKLVSSDLTGACADGQMAIRATGARFVCVSGTWAPASIIASGAADPACGATTFGLEFLNTSVNPSVKKVCGKNSAGNYAWGTVTVTGW